MALTTSFRATGRCPNCHTEGEIWIQSHVGSRGATYRIGDDVVSDIPPSAIESASFLVRAPAPGEPVHVLMTWSCDACDVEHFAEVVFAAGRVSDIQPIELTVAALDRLHYVEMSSNDKIEEIIGRSIWDQHGVWPGWVRALREKLARAEGTFVEPAASGFADFGDFPLGYTLGGGLYEPDQLYMGGGDDQLFFGHSKASPGIRYLISTTPNNGLVIAKDGPDLLRCATGLFVPRFVGGYDPPPEGKMRRSHCAFVEELPPGGPLLRAVPDLRPHAVGLGAQIGRLLGRAVSEAGVLDLGLRPEYVWVTVDGGTPTVTGVGGRNGGFFGAARRRRDMVTAWLFTHRYHAPEVNRGEPHDDRALVITLAVMVAEWLIGAYPYPQDDGLWGYRRLCTGDHVALPVEPRLAALLSSALRPDPADRPDLATFTSALASFAAR